MPLYFESNEQAGSLLASIYLCSQPDMHINAREWELLLLSRYKVQAPEASGMPWWKPNLIPLARLLPCQDFLSVMKAEFSFSFFLCGVGVWTQDLTHARQMFYRQTTTSSALKGKFPTSFRQLAFKEHCHGLQWQTREPKLELNVENDSESLKGNVLPSSEPTTCRVYSRGDGVSHCHESVVRRQVSSIPEWLTQVCTFCKVSHQTSGGSTKVIHDDWLQVHI